MSKPNDSAPNPAFDTEQVIREYLPQIIHLSLETSEDNHPWVCEVHFAFDDDLALYFVSDRSRRHCVELRANPKIAGNIVTQHHRHQKVRGVYFEGTAAELEDVDEHHPGVIAYNQRFTLPPQAVQAASAARLYKITVSDFYVFDGYVSDPPRKYHLPWKP